MDEHVKDRERLARGRKETGKSTLSLWLWFLSLDEKLKLSKKNG